MCVRVSVYVSRAYIPCVSVCVCVREREREREVLTEGVLLPKAAVSVSFCNIM